MTPSSHAVTPARSDAARKRPTPRQRRGAIAAAAVAGALYCGSVPGFDLWPLAFVSLCPLLFALETGANTGRAAAGLGLVFGLVANAFGFHWLVPTLRQFGGFPWAVCLLLSAIVWAYQSGHFILFAWLLHRARTRGLPWLWLAPGLFACGEWLFPQLFPAYLAAALHDQAILMQVLDLGGVLCLSALLVAANAALYALFWHRRRSLVAVIGALWVANLAYGSHRIAEQERTIATAPKLEVGLVQANLGLREKRRNPALSLQRHRSASVRLEAEAPVGLLVWPESAISRLPPLADLRAQLQAPLLLGAVRREPISPRSEEARRTGHNDRVYNSAILVDRKGRVTGTYDKTFLLAFAETIPLGGTFPWLYDLSPRSGRFRKGERQAPLPLPAHAGQPSWRIGALICYEAIVPAFVRRAMRAGSPHLLVNLTNDAWFGDTVEPWTHLGLSQLRAVEHHRYLVRATNSGVSAIIDPLGRIVAHTGTFEATTLRGEVARLEGRTLYGQVGDAFGWLGLLAALMAIFGPDHSPKHAPSHERSTITRFGE